MESKLSKWEYLSGVLEFHADLFLCAHVQVQ